MSYSPGPWRSKGGSIKALSHGKEYTVAIVDRKKFTSEGRAGNARLIAASPEMLEALRLIERWTSDEVIASRGTKVERYIMELVRPLIYKADGLE
jgi:hypothetical protein